MEMTQEIRRDTWVRRQVGGCSVLVNDIDISFGIISHLTKEGEIRGKRISTVKSIRS